MRRMILVKKNGEPSKRLVKLLATDLNVVENSKDPSKIAESQQRLREYSHIVEEKRDDIWLFRGRAW